MRTILYCVMIFYLSSCVSVKKYKTISSKYEDGLNKIDSISNRNDFLTLQVILYESKIDFLKREKNTSEIDKLIEKLNEAKNTKKAFLNKTFNTGDYLLGKYDLDIKTREVDSLNRALKQSTSILLRSQLELNKKLKEIDRLNKELDQNRIIYNYLLNGNEIGDEMHLKWGFTDQKYEQSLFSEKRFPIPPPQPSSRLLLHDSIFGKDSSCYGRRKKMIDLLFAKGVEIAGYFSLQENYGYAIMLPIQEFDPKTKETKRKVDTKTNNFFWELTDYIKQIFQQDIGYYRLPIFIISDKALSFADENLSLDNAYKLVQGSSVVPENIAIKVKEKCYCYFLIYEFIKTEINKNPDRISNSKNSALEHLRVLKLFKQL